VEPRREPLQFCQDFFTCHGIAKYWDRGRPARSVSDTRTVFRQLFHWPKVFRALRSLRAGRPRSQYHVGPSEELALYFEVEYQWLRSSFFKPADVLVH
jgi:hypothetical protein